MIAVVPKPPGRLEHFQGYLDYYWEDIIQLTIDHAEVVAMALAIGTVISVTLGVLTYRRARASNIALAVTGVFLTIPSFALLAMFVKPFGLGLKPTIIALTMYSLLPIVRNTITGLREVDPAITESAKGMGMTAAQRLVKVELPMAWPIIITGIRVSAIMLIGIAAIAAVVNGPGLGLLIFRGLAVVGSPAALSMVLAGTLGVIFLALVFDGVFLIIEKFTTSRGLRG